MIGLSTGKIMKTKNDVLNKRQETYLTSKPTLEADRKPSLLINNMMSKNIIYNLN